MPRALGLAVDLAHDDDDEEQHSLIELSSNSGAFNPEHSTYSPNNQRRRRSFTTTSLRHLGSASSTTSPFCKLMAALFILSIICVYKLGLQEGRNVAYEESSNGYIEDVESKNSGDSAGYQVLKSKGSGEKSENEDSNNNPWVLFHDKDDNGGGKVVQPEKSLPTPSPTKLETPPPVPTYTPTQQEEPSDAEEEEEEEEDEDESSISFYKPPSNPYIDKFKFNTSAFLTFHQNQWKQRAQNAIDIKTKYGSYCSNVDKFPDDKPMCPPLQVVDNTAIYEWDVKILNQGPTVQCMETGTKDIRCGRSDPWLNKTIWPLVRGPFCAVQDKQRNEKIPLPEELKPYYELGYDRVDPTKSTDGKPFNGGTPSPSKNKLFTFGPKIVQDHLLKFEAMLDHYYQGLSTQLLERQLSPTPESEYYLPMLTSYANQISRIILRSTKNGGDINDEMNKLVIGVLGDSVTSGTDNCYYDAWPEQLRRQLSPIFASMNINIEIRNAGKNGGWNLSPQMLCAHDMLGVNDERYIENDGLGLDFLFQCNNFVKATAVDAEHLIRRALLGGSGSHSTTVISMNLQKDMDGDAFIERYSKYGLSIGNVYQDALPELGLPESGYKYWFPANDRAFWGMQGDGFCHLTTRSGSSSVVNRNWHWGPKTHQTYADAYALLLVRATRMAIDDLVAGRMPPDSFPKPSDVEVLMDAPSEDTPPSYRDLYISDMISEKADNNNNGGISGVRCAVGAANQPNSTLLSHWLRPAEGSPFEEKMKSRNGVSFVPIDHLNSTGFYKVSSPISPPNNAVEVGDWVADPTSFGAEAPRTREQCLHVDGSTLVNMNNKPDISWLVWVSSWRICLSY